MSLIDTRGHQMFPVLDAAQIETAKRFASGAARQFAPGEMVYDVGERHTPAWLVLDGTIEIGRRDGLNHETAITTLGVGQFTGEVGQLSGRATLAFGRAGPDGCTALPVRRRASARAGGRLGGGRRDADARLHPAPRRADPGRRRRLGADRPAGRAGPRAAAGLSRPQRLSLHRARRRQRRGRPRRGRAPRRAARRAAADALPERHRAQAAHRRRGGRVPRHHARARSADALRRRRRRRRAGRPRHRGLRRVRGPLGAGARPARLRRTGRRLGADRELSRLSRPASRAWRWPGARSTRRRSSAPSSPSRSRWRGSIAAAANGSPAIRGGSSSPTAARCRRAPWWSPPGARYRRPDIPNLATFEGAGVSYLGLADRGEAVRGRGGGAGRRRQLGRPGGRVPRAQGQAPAPGRATAGSRRRCRATSSTASPRCRTSSCTSAPRWSRSKATRTRGSPPRSSATGRAGTSTAARCATCSCSSAPIPTPPGSTTASRSIGKGFVVTGRACPHFAVAARRDILPLETSLPGVFAIGDVRAGSTKRVAAAVGEGAAVVAQIHSVLGVRE